MPDEGSQVDGEKVEKPSSPNVATCNVILKPSNLDSEGLFTAEELEVFRAEVPEGSVEEVHMNLRGGKVLPESSRLATIGANNNSEAPKEAPLQGMVKTTTSKGKAVVDADYNVVAHLKRIPAMLSVYDALMMVPDLRMALVEALRAPEVYEAAMAESRPYSTPLYVNEITFTEEDKVVDESDHNRPLYIEGNIGDAHLRRILIDPGSAVNILPIRSWLRAG